MWNHRCHFAITWIAVVLKYGKNVGGKIGAARLLVYIEEMVVRQWSNRDLFRLISLIPYMRAGGNGLYLNSNVLDIFTDGEKDAYRVDLKVSFCGTGARLCERGERSWIKSWNTGNILISKAWG